MTKVEIIAYAANTYQSKPEYLWERDPQSAVLRHTDNGKCYAALLHVSGKKLGLPTDAQVDILNVKCDPDTIALMTAEPGFSMAWHMNKKHWITILLNGMADDTVTLRMLDRSYEITKKR